MCVYEVTNIQVQCIVVLWKWRFHVARSSDFSKEVRNLVFFNVKIPDFYMLQNKFKKSKNTELNKRNHLWAKLSLCAARGQL